MFDVVHSPKQLDLFTNKNSTILWEPGSGDTPVYYDDMQARFIATVTLYEKLFHKFRKSAKTFYMPCPSELQLRLMGQVYRRFARELQHSTDAAIHDRVKKLGPFIRTVLCWCSIKRDKVKLKNTYEINSICSTAKTLNTALESEDQIMKTSRVFSGLSHRLARYVVHRNSAEYYLGYTHCHYRFSCEEVLKLFSVVISQMGIEAVKEHLLAVNQGDNVVEDSLPLYLKRMFELYALKSLNWRCRQMQLHSESTRELDWANFIVKFHRVERSITTFQNMAAQVLYYPSDTSFPLVDMYFKDEFGKLVGIQATMSKKHPKTVSTHERFYEELQTNPHRTPLELYYLIIPRFKDHYSQSSYDESQFLKGVLSQNESIWKNNISFYALVPPDNFDAITP